MFIGQALKTQGSLFVSSRIEVSTIRLACHATDCSLGYSRKLLAYKPESGHDSGDPLRGVGDRRDRVTNASCFFGQVPFNLRPHSTAHPSVSRVASQYISTGLEREKKLRSRRCLEHPTQPGPCPNPLALAGRTCWLSSHFLRLVTNACKLISMKLTVLLHRFVFI